MFKLNALELKPFHVNQVIAFTPVLLRVNMEQEFGVPESISFTLEGKIQGIKHLISWVFLQQFGLLIFKMLLMSQKVFRCVLGGGILTVKRGGTLYVLHRRAAGLLLAVGVP